MSHSDVIRQLTDYRQRFPLESGTIDRFEAFVRGEPRCFQRNCWAGHVTGSAWIVNAPQTHVLLTHHRKLNRWLQLGGHSDGDGDPLRVACREAVEESGLVVAPVSDLLFDIDIHLIPARMDDPAHHHFDARFALRAIGDDAFLRQRRIARIAMGEDRRDRRVYHGAIDVAHGSEVARPRRGVRSLAPRSDCYQKEPSKHPRWVTVKLAFRVDPCCGVLRLFYMIESSSNSCVDIA